MSVTRVSLSEGYRAEIKTRNHVHYTDEPVDAGGTDSAVTPMEMLLGSLGSCIAITMKLYADRKGWPLERVEIALESERFNADDYPDYEGDERFIHEIRESLVIHGPLDEKQRERLIDIATKCPVARLIATPTFWKQEVLETLPEISE